MSHGAAYDGWGQASDICATNRLLGADHHDLRPDRLHGYLPRDDRGAQIEQDLAEVRDCR